MQHESEFTDEEMAILRPMFLKSGREYIRDFQAALDEVKTGPLDDATLEAMHRSIHSLKGAAMQLRVIHIGTLAQAMEAVAKTARAAGVAIPPEGVELLKEGIGRLLTYLDSLENDQGQVEPPGALLGRLEGVAESMTRIPPRRKATEE